MILKTRWKEWGYLQILAPTPRECVLKFSSWKDCSKKKHVTLSLCVQKGKVHLKIQAFTLPAFLGRLRSCERNLRMGRQALALR